MKEARDFKDRTYLIDTLKQNTRDLKSCYKGPENEDGINWLNTAGSAELYERLVNIEPPKSNHREILAIFDDISKKYGDKENWSTIQNRSPIINEMHNFIVDVMHNGSKNFKNQAAKLDALQRSLAFESPGNNNSDWEDSDTDLAIRLRDTLGIAIKKLHTEVVQRLRNPQYAYLKNLIDWDDFLGIGDNVKDSLQGRNSQNLPAFLYQQQTHTFAAADRVGQIIGAATFAFESNAARARQEKYWSTTASCTESLPINLS